MPSFDILTSKLQHNQSRTPLQAHHKGILWLDQPNSTVIIQLSASSVGQNVELNGTSHLHSFPEVVLMAYPN